MVANLGLISPLALALVTLGVMASDARAQGNTFNPYGNSGYADYREFGSPMLSNNPSLPGQARLNAEPIITRPRANSFQQYSDSLDGLDPVGGPSASRRSSAGLPYYQAYRQYDKEYNRVYRPNVDADKGFDDRLRRRDQDYAKALQEKDPVKRGKLLRQIEQNSLDKTPVPRARRAAPAANASRAGTTPATTTRAPNPTPATTTRAPDSTPAAGVRRAPMPSPSARPVTPSSTVRSAAPTAPRTNPPAARIQPRLDTPPDPSTIAIPPPG